MLTRMVQQIASFAQCGHHACVYTRARTHLHVLNASNALRTSTSGMLSVPAMHAVQQPAADSEAYHQHRIPFCWFLRRIESYNPQQCRWQDVRAEATQEEGSRAEHSLGCG